MTGAGLKKGVIKRSEKRLIGLFIDGVNLDRATRRLKRKIDLQALVRGVTSGATPVVARYYTVIPFEDDSRHRSFLDAVERAGLSVIVKRLPPKGVTRQVTTDVEMAADLAAFALGHTNFSKLSQYSAGMVHEYAVNKELANQAADLLKTNQELGSQNGHPKTEQVEDHRQTKRIITVVCPSRDLAYPLDLAKELGADTVNADFGQFTGGDILKNAAKWIDLSDSETIWRE